MGHLKFKVGEITAVIGDNADHAPASGHRAGYNGIWDFQHRTSMRSIFGRGYLNWSV
jgi:hypothetical protein